MTRLCKYIIFIAIGMVIHCQTMFADSNIIKNGINKVDLGWLTQSQRSIVIANMIKSGIKTIRVTLVPPFKNTIEAITEADNAGLHIVININTNFKEFYSSDVASVRFHQNYVWPLSMLNVEMFKHIFSPLWNEMDAKSITIDAVEIENEINTAGYNADIVMSNVAEAYSGHLSSLSDRNAFEKGLAHYSIIVAYVRSLRDQSRNLKGARLIGPGFAMIRPDIASQSHLPFINVAETKTLLDHFRTSEMLDGYSVHFYFDKKDINNFHSEEFETLKFCSLLSKPCWITEWGVASSERCDDPSRIPTLQQIQGSIDEAEKNGSVAAAYYFDWDGHNDSFALWRCDHLTKEGVSVIKGF